MNKIKPTLEHWLEDLDNFNFPRYEQFPDIELYMDQVIKYLDVELKVFKAGITDKVVTHSMINNYVKGDVVTAPLQKKYNREHLALINETCSLKQVLSISEIKQIIDLEYEDSNADAFNSFASKSIQEFHEASKYTKDIIQDIDDDNDVKKLTNTALDLAIKANAYITIAKRILLYCKMYNDMKEINNELNKNE